MSGGVVVRAGKAGGGVGRWKQHGGERRQLGGDKEQVSMATDRIFDHPVYIPFPTNLGKNNWMADLFPITEMVSTPGCTIDVWFIYPLYLIHSGALSMEK